MDDCPTGTARSLSAQHWGGAREGRGSWVEPVFSAQLCKRLAPWRPLTDPWPHAPPRNAMTHGIGYTVITILLEGGFSGDRDP
jgi:hypothetical protein